VTDDARIARREAWVAVGLLWLAGNALRLTILAVPPVIAMIRHDLDLSATEVGLLSSIAPALFAVAALLGSLLVAHLGVRTALVGSLLVVAAGSALRGLSDAYATLFATTIVMSVGVALMQPIMPATVRHWLPHRAALGTAVYTNGLLVGEVVPVLLTVPYLLGALHSSWRAALAFWSLPVLVTAAAVQLFAPRPPVRRPLRPDAPRRWLPDWHIGLVWRLGALFGCVNAIYFSANAFIPIYLTNAGRPDLISHALLALNFGQLPASILLLGIAGRLERRAWPFIASGVLSLVALAGIVVQGGTSTIMWAGLLGFADAVALILGLTLPPLLCRPEDVARTSAGMFTLSYAGAVAMTVGSGALWDLSGIPATAFAPMAVCALALVVVTVALRLNKELR